MLQTAPEILQSIKQAYQWLDEAMPTLLPECQDSNQQKQLLSIRDALRDAYYSAINKTLADDSPTVKVILADLKATQTKIGNDTNLLQDINNTIQVATELAKLASSLAVLAATA